jgi:hypothetical protein
MPAVFAEVDGDAVRAGGGAGLGDGERVRVGAAAGITHGGDMVDIHAEADWITHSLNM